MLRQVLTYNFSNDNTRSSFEELVDALGFVKAEDQSTYVLDLEANLTSIIVRNHIVQWSNNPRIVIEESDFVQIFFNNLLVRAGRRIAAIGSRYLSFDRATKGLH